MRVPVARVKKFVSGLDADADSGRDVLKKWKINWLLDQSARHELRQAAMLMIGIVVGRLWAGCLAVDGPAQEFPGVLEREF